MISWAPFEVPARASFQVRRIRPPAAAVWAALWVAAIAAEALALRPVLFDREAPVQSIEVVVTLVGGSFAACGLIAWRRRPDSRSGVLMTATGFLFLVPSLLVQVDGELAATVRVLVTDWWVFAFVPLILTLHTGGRLQTRLDRALVASFALPLGVGQVAWMCSTPRWAACCWRSPTPTWLT